MTRQATTPEPAAGGSAAAASASAASPPAGDLLQVTDLVQEFTVKGSRPFARARVSAVAGVSFSIARGETFALVGETGSGKTTIARALLASPPAASGSITLNGRPLPVGRRARPATRGAAARGGSGVQMVFQDPFGALDPRWTIARSIAEPLVTAGVAGQAERRRRIAAIMHLVGLDASRFAQRLPRELLHRTSSRRQLGSMVQRRRNLKVSQSPAT